MGLTLLGRSRLQVDRSKDDIYFASEQSLSYLDGSLAGDYGFDPLGVSDPEGAGVFISPQWLSYAEIIHGRFAMLGLVSALYNTALLVTVVSKRRNVELI